MSDITALERRALELMKLADFGAEAVRVNEAILAAAPANERAWTRLGRCRLEQNEFDAAVDALRRALSLNPANTVATNLLNECRKRRALTPTAVDRATTGFTAREFAQLEAFGDSAAAAALTTRIDLLLESINATTTATKVVDARRRAGAATSSKLFHAHTVHAGGPGHVYVFHYGGRWEPQWNIGWFAPPSLAPCMRIGLGFNTSSAGRDPDRAAGQEQILRFFEAFQRTIAGAWRSELARWMADNSGFIQHGEQPPARDVLPARAVEWMLSCQNAAAVGWVFVGRWLFLERPDDARIMRERSKLARAADDTFRALLPIWLATYAGSAD